MSMGRWCNDTDSENQSTRRTSASATFFLHKSHTDWPVELSPRLHGQRLCGLSFFCVPLPELLYILCSFTRIAVYFVFLYQSCCIFCVPLPESLYILCSFTRIAVYFVFLYQSCCIFFESFERCCGSKSDLNNLYFFLGDFSFFHVCNAISVVNPLQFLCENREM
jgi:hypothetical protein